MSESAPENTLALLRVMEEFLRIDPNLPVVATVVFLAVAARPGQSNQDIASATGMTESRVSRNCTLLEQAGLLERKRDPQNARVKRNALAPEGVRLLNKMTSALRT